METREFSLTESERFTLDTLLADSSSRARRRARIVLEWAEGKDKFEIARALNSRHPHIHRVTDAFQEKRLASFSAAALRRAATPAPQKNAPKIPPLTAQSSMHAAARQILAHQFSKLERVEPDVRAANDVEAVHDMRVACRRINSAFRLFKAYLPNKRVKKLRGVMEQLRDTLGAARNLDVLSADLDAFAENVSDTERAQLQLIRDEWNQQRASQQNALLTLLDSAEFAKWCKRMEQFLAEEDTGATSRVADVLPALLWRQYGAVRAYETRLNQATLEELHALRIDIKRLRYTLEFFADAFGDKPTQLIEPLIALQDQLGLMQDAVVAGQALTAFIVTQARTAQEQGALLADFQAIAAYHAHLQNRITELRAQLPAQCLIITNTAYRELLAQTAARL